MGTYKIVIMHLGKNFQNGIKTISSVLLLSRFPFKLSYTRKNNHIDSWKMKFESNSVDCQGNSYEEITYTFFQSYTKIYIFFESY